MNPVAGKMMRSLTWWPVSHRCVVMASRPETTIWSWSARWVMAPSKGWSGRSSPAALTSALVAGVSQYRRCSKG
ncbi:hypothetical protein MSIMFB_03247 [Mycobacterium simulans]|uniref:Uncharacterized protein n=1 Tax=Mycobacterium simulans TaxID=627089 RepID=A0A7Z7IM72_9MYCO|nr:hypothetical protein MSIMFB_03247 [Mycobacterium simulans]